MALFWITLRMSIPTSYAGYPKNLAAIFVHGIEVDTTPERKPLTEQFPIPGLESISQEFEIHFTAVNALFNARVIDEGLYQKLRRSVATVYVETMANTRVKI